MITEKTKKSCITALKSFAEIISKQDQETFTRDSVEHIVSENFLNIDIQGFSGNFKSIKSIVDFKQKDKLLEISFKEENDHLHKAIFSEKGKILAIKFECPVCFGTGFNNDEICDFCSHGWGPI